MSWGRRHEGERSAARSRPRERPGRNRDPLSKGGGEYIEGRDYRCDDEDSRYEIRLRYTRTA